MADAGVADIEIRDAGAGDPWVTWRGTRREFHPEPGRRVVNAWLGDAIVGSALMSTVEADEEHDGLDAWSFADAHMAYVYGPYFHSQDEFSETVYLHFESLYVLEAHRRQGIAERLIEQVADVGLPTVCQFAAPFLPAVFERWTPDPDGFDDIQTTMNSPGGSLCAHLAMAADSGVDWPVAFDDGPFELEAQFELLPHRRTRSVDAGVGELTDEHRPDVPEGTPEPDLLDDAEAAGWHEDDLESFVQTVEWDVCFQLSEERAGVSLGNLEVGLEEAPADRHGPAIVSVAATGVIENAHLLAARAAWRRFLATYEDEWEPSSVDEAMAEVLRLRSGHTRRVVVKR